MNLSELCSAMFEHVNKMSAGNQIIAGAISLWGMGVLTYVCREIPRHVFDFVFKHLTTEMTVTSYNVAFHRMMDWFNRKGYAAKIRRIKLSNGRWGSNDKVLKTVGYGQHVVWYRWTPIWIALNRDENKNTDADKEIVTLIKFGRSHALFNEFIKEIDQVNENHSKTAVYTESKGNWVFAGYQPKRDFSSVIVAGDVKHRLLKTVDEFLRSENWYNEHGIPYQLGIMLYGPPGTGKTSVIRALAAYTDRDVYTVSASSLVFYPEILYQVNEKSVLVVEDIDGCAGAVKRHSAEKNQALTITNERKKPESTPPGKPIGEPAREASFESRFATSCVSELLNAIDGIVSSHGRMLVMTTNHPEKLDAALLRPGRCDVKLEIGYMNDETCREFLSRFFDTRSVETAFDDRELSDEKLTGAELQRLVRDGLGLNDIVEAITQPRLK